MKYLNKDKCFKIKWSINNKVRWNKNTIKIVRKEIGNKFMINYLEKLIH